MKTSKEAYIETTTTIQLDANDIVKLLLNSHIISKKQMNPGVTDLHISFKVPEGGDYSGLRMEINDEHPITVTWKMIERRTPA